MNHTTSTVEDARAHRLFLIAMASWLMTFVIAAAYPAGRPADERMSLSFAATYGWIAFQCVVLVLPGLLIGSLVGRILPRVGSVLGAALMLGVPLIVFCDAMTFTWIAERFLSSTLANIVTTLLPGLLLHVSSAEIVQAAIAVGLTALAVIVLWNTSGRIAQRWHAKPDAVSPRATTGVLMSLAAAMAMPAFLNYSRTVNEMEQASVRNPFCAFRFVGFHGVGIHRPTGQAAVPDRLTALHAAPQAFRHETAQLSLGVADDFDPQLSRPNVIVVVIECFRPEYVQPEIMPNLHAFAKKSIYCRNHFSSGNATCLGMFGLVTGAEAIWFERRIANEPILNRLLAQAGYRRGFFGGQTDWKHFGMSGFVREGVYDDFQIELPVLPETDLRTVRRAVKHIESPADGPKAAVTYMFATHSLYSDPEDQIYLPAADDSIVVRHSPEAKGEVRNRYKNSLRTMDKMIQPLLRDDCTVIVLGDHGEPFLDDGTAVHGTRLSRYQNMTPAIIYSPDVPPQEIRHITSHADLLPTLLSILNIPVTDDQVFDGVDLTSASETELAERTFVSRNYMDRTSVLVGPWTLDPQQPFGYRVLFDLTRWQLSYLNPIDDRGFQWQSDTSDAIDAGPGHFKRWVQQRFGNEAWQAQGSTKEMFTQFLQSPSGEVRLAALKIASELDQPEPYLYELVAQATRSQYDPEREYAKELIIRINRRMGASQ